MNRGSDEQPGGGKGDQVRVTIQVAVEPNVAFQVFTEEIDQWWRRGIKFRASGKRSGIMKIEPWIGGRLYEAVETDTEVREIVTGQVTAWEPPERLVFWWQGINFAPHEKTEVEVQFASVPSGTLVTLTHRGWSQIRDDHPARHGLSTQAFCRMLGMWWADLLKSLDARAGEREEGRGARDEGRDE